MKTRVKQKHKNRTQCWCRCKCGNQIAKQREKAGYILCQPCWDEDHHTHGIRQRDHGGPRVATPSRAHSKAAARRIWVHLTLFHRENDPQVATLGYARLAELHRLHHDEGKPGHETMIPFAVSRPRRVAA